MGNPIDSKIVYQDSRSVRGFTVFKKDIKVIDLSIKVSKSNQRIIRRLNINNKNFFLNNEQNKDLHLVSYKEILNNKRIKIEQVEKPLKLIFKMQKNYDRIFRIKGSK